MSDKLTKQAAEYLKNNDINEFSKEDACEVAYQTGYLTAVDEVIDILEEELHACTSYEHRSYGDTEVCWRDADNWKNPHVKRTFFDLIRKRLGVE